MCFIQVYIVIINKQIAENTVQNTQMQCFTKMAFISFQTATENKNTLQKIFAADFLCRFVQDKIISFADISCCTMIKRKRHKK